MQENKSRLLKLVFNALCGCVLCWTPPNCSASDEYKDASELQQKGNLWKKGEPIPARLLDYKTSYIAGSCFPDMSGTDMLFQGITNYPLLREIAFLPQLDARVFSNAVNCAVTLVGPKRFFSDSLETLAKRPELVQQDRFKALQIQATVKHIVVDSLYITYADMPPKEATKVLDQIATELRTGNAWDDVYPKFTKMYERSWQEKQKDGTIATQSRTRIGNLGDFVLAANGNPLFSSRRDWMPKKHVKKLFSAKAGDILILFDKEDMSRYGGLGKKETGKRLVLHKVREVYSGNKGED